MYKGGYGASPLFDHYFWSHMFSFLGANGMFYLSLLCRQLNEYSHSVHCVEAWKKICFNLVKDQFSGDEQILQDVKCLANPNEASLCDTDLDKLANPYINLRASKKRFTQFLIIRK